MSKCKHTINAVNKDGSLSGTWTRERTAQRVRVVCSACGVEFAEPPESAEREAELRRAYLEQQRRLSCPGCGEEPFLG